MKVFYADITSWLRDRAAEVWTEIRAISAAVTRLDLTAPHDTTAAEHLAAACLVLCREHDDLLDRIREQFGRTPACESSAPAVPADAHPRAIVVAVHRSVRARAAALAIGPDHFDPQTRFLLRLHRCITDGVVIPALDAALGQIADVAELPAEPPPAGRAPAVRRHRDCFLAGADPADRIQP